MPGEQATEERRHASAGTGRATTVAMTSEKQRRSARANSRKAASVARRKSTIAHLAKSKRRRRALRKQATIGKRENDRP